MKKKQRQQVPLTPVLAVALVLVLAVTYLVLIRPKGKEASDLDAQIADLETQAALVTHDSGKPEPKVQIDVADIIRLAKAMPDGSDMAGIMLELNAIASSSGVSFVAIQPSDPLALGQYSAQPINLTFDGNYYDLTDFLYRLRSLVSVKDGVLDASGRLYTLDSLDLHEEPDSKFPNIEAVLTLSAYSYGAEAVPVVPGAPPATTSRSTDTTQTSTGATTTGTTTTSTNETQAAGAGG